MNELAVQGTKALSTKERLAAMRDYADVILKSGICPADVNSPEKVIIILATGAELGMQEMRSMRNLYVVNRRCAMMAETMLSLIRERLPGFVMNTKVSDEKVCLLEASRDGKNFDSFKYTIEEAAKAGLTLKDNWKKYPTDMLWARCIARMSRRLAPDILGGVSYVPEELSPDIQLGPDGAPIHQFSTTGAQVTDRAKAIEIDVQSVGAVPQEKIVDLSAADPVAKAPVAAPRRARATKEAAPAVSIPPAAPKPVEVVKDVTPPNTPATPPFVPPAPEVDEGPAFVLGDATEPKDVTTSAPQAHPAESFETFDAAEAEDYGDYTIKTGTWAGKKFKELGKAFVSQLANKTQKKIAEKPGTLTDNTREFLHAAEMWTE